MLPKLQLHIQSTSSQSIVLTILSTHQTIQIHCIGLVYVILILNKVIYGLMAHHMITMILESGWNNPCGPFEPDPSEWGMSGCDCAYSRRTTTVYYFLCNDCKFNGVLTKYIILDDIKTWNQMYSLDSQSELKEECKWKSYVLTVWPTVYTSAIFGIFFAFVCIVITRHWLQSCGFSSM